MLLTTFGDFPVQMTSLTSVSTFFPFTVMGISSTGIMNLGTCLELRPARMACLSLEARLRLNGLPGHITTNRKTDSSKSMVFRRRPTQRVDKMTSLKGGASVME